VGNFKGNCFGYGFQEIKFLYCNPRQKYAGTVPIQSIFCEKKSKSGPFQSNSVATCMELCLQVKKKKLTEDGHFLQLCIEIAQVEAVEHGEGSFHQTAFQHQMARSGQDILSSGSSDNQNCHSQL
jgi:hypothetical protein